MAGPVLQWWGDLRVAVATRRAGQLRSSRKSMGRITKSAAAIGMPTESVCQKSAQGFFFSRRSMGGCLLRVFIPIAPSDLPTRGDALNQRDRNQPDQECRRA